MDQKDHGAELAAVGNDTTAASPQRQAHTPGPWEVDTDREIGETISIQHRGAFIATVHNVDDFPCVDDDDAETVEAECVANARLIAAAPDMLSALRKVPIFRITTDGLGCECVGCGSVDGVNPDGSERREECKPGCYVVITESAIAKAEGR